MRKIYLLIFIFAVVSIIFSIYFTKNKEHMKNHKINKKITLYFSPHCTFCKKFKPIWDKCKHNKSSKYHFSEINCTDSNCDGIEGYPTVCIDINGEKTYKSGFMSHDQFNSLIEN